LATLTAISKPKPEEVEETKELKKSIAELKKILPDLTTKLTDISTEHGTIRAEGIAIIAERKIIDDEIKDIINVDIPAIETALAQSEKDIEMLKDNIKENEIIENETAKENKKMMKEYEDTFNIAVFRAPIYFINLWLISYRHRYCTYLYYSSSDFLLAPLTATLSRGEMQMMFSFFGSVEKILFTRSESKTPLPVPTTT